MELLAQHISFRYACGQRPILEDFSLRLRSGERLGLLAPSGFGKTTFCRILAGYQQPDSGEILLDGRPLASYKGYSPVQLVWQHPEWVLDPRMQMQAILAQAGPVELRLIQALGIRKDWLHRYPGELSGGEQQRFCLARALAPGVRFLLADEISTMLDLITQAQLWRFLLEEVEQRGLGLLTVSHDPELLRQVCQEVRSLG